MVVGVELFFQLPQHAGRLTHQPAVDGGRSSHLLLRGDLFIGVLAHPRQGALDAPAAKAVDDVFHCDVAGEAPQPRVPPAPQPEVAEDAVEDGVEIQPVEVLRVLLVKPQQSTGLVAEDGAVGRQHTAPLVGGGRQGREGLIQKAEVQIQPAAHHGQHLAAHPGLPLLMRLGAGRLEGLAGVEKLFLLRNQNHTSSFGAQRHAFCALRRPAGQPHRRCRPWRRGQRPRQRRRRP